MLKDMLYTCYTILNIIGKVNFFNYHYFCLALSLPKHLIVYYKMLYALEIVEKHMYTKIDFNQEDLPPVM